jgi:anaerobic C4-dicarboxylate transporter DcuA
MDMATFILEFLVVVVCLIMGVRMGGIGLGIWGGVGVFVLIFIFGLPPGSIPGSAMLIILAVVTAAGAMQAAGGIDWLVQVAAKLIRKRPRLITLIAPLVSYAFVVGAGTSNIFYPLIPVIYEVSYDAGIRPERPLSLATVATALGITSSPVAAAMAAMVALMEPQGVTLNQILAVTIPSSIIAILVGSVVMMRWGKNLENDPEFQKRLAEGKVAPPKTEAQRAETPPALPRMARISAIIFLVGVVFVVLIALVPGMVPSWEVETAPGVFETQQLSMTQTIEIIMLLVATIIIVVGRVKPSDVIKQQTFTAGIVALLALFGVAWMANTFIEAHLDQIVAVLGDWVAVAPWVFAVAIFVVAALTTSQSATTNTVVPIGLALPTLGMGQIVAMWQALTGVYFLPANGTQLAAVETDLTGSTRLTKFVVYHSFTVPLFVLTIVSVLVGLGMAAIVGI